MRLTLNCRNSLIKRNTGTYKKNGGLIFIPDIKEEKNQQDETKPKDEDHKASFIIRCCRHLEKNGYAPDEAKKWCSDVWEATNIRDPGQDIPLKPGGGDSDGQGGRKQSAEPERELFCLSCEDIQPLINTSINLSDKGKTGEISFNDDKDNFRATCVYGDRFYKGKFLPMKELQKSYQSLNNTYHDINHWGTTYLDGNPNVEYVVGYNDNVKLDNTTKALTADIHVLKNTEKYRLWRGFVDINQKINKTPNVSVSFFSSKKKMRASELQGIDLAAHGYNKDDEIDYLYDMDFQALSTVFKGACSDKDGCGIQKQDAPCCQDTGCKHNEDKQKKILEEKINRMKGKE